jgi:hypothetical protein
LYGICTIIFSEQIPYFQFFIGARELTLVKVEPFHGTDDEDPHEWIELFNQAATANQWPDNRKVAIAAGLLRDAAHDWYINDRTNILQWHQPNQPGNFDDRFIAHFSPKRSRTSGIMS